MAVTEDLDLGFEEQLSGSVVEDELTPEDRAQIPLVVGAVLGLTRLLAIKTGGVELHPFQEELAERLIESVVANDGDEITALFSRQAGKTETVADCLAAIMILLPVLAAVPSLAHLLARFRFGVKVGTFAPTQDQADTLFERLKDRLTAPESKEILGDPEIADEAVHEGDRVRLRRNRSFCRVMTAHPKAKVESKTYDIIVVDEAQGLDQRMYSKSISPMGASTNATKVLLGTPDIVRGVFYDAIKRNKRDATRRGGRRNHFEFDWTVKARYAPDYRKYVQKEAARIGVDSDEFRLAYKLEWILERGMFISSGRMDELGDRGMGRQKSWPQPCVAGIDPARKIDSTVVTVVWVDWNSPNENGQFHHRVLDWLEIQGENWEEQYFRILEFLRHFNIVAVGVDGGGMGDVIKDRLSHLLDPSITVEALSSSPQAQHQRWLHLTELMGGTHHAYGNLFAYPANAAARRTKTWQRFYLQMTELEKKYQGPYMLTEAPKEAGAHDDYPDSLALACMMSKDLMLPELEVVDNFLMR